MFEICSGFGFYSAFSDWFFSFRSTLGQLMFTLNVLDQLSSHMSQSNHLCKCVWVCYLLAVAWGVFYRYWDREKWPGHCRPRNCKCSHWLTSFAKMLAKSAQSLSSDESACPHEKDQSMAIDLPRSHSKLNLWRSYRWVRNSSTSQCLKSSWFRAQKSPRFLLHWSIAPALALCTSLHDLCHSAKYASALL